jgi:hypothetical protein
MITRIVALAIFTTVIGVRPASAYLEIDWADGSATYVADGFVWLCIFTVIVAVAAFIGALSPSEASRGDVADATDSAEYFDSEAARFRAMSRKLDAETDLAENLIKARRTREELGEIEQLFGNKKTKRNR